MADQWMNRLTIKSETSSREYVISEWAPGGMPTGTWGCSCPGWKGYGGQCKHLRAMGRRSCRARGEPMPRGLGTSDNFTFTDEAYQHYDTSHGYGSWSEWIRQAEDQARGRSRYREYIPPRGSAGFYDLKMEAMKIFGFTSLPQDVKELVRAMRRLAMKWHPDREGGDAAKFDEMIKAYERLLRYYPRG